MERRPRMETTLIIILIVIAVLAIIGAYVAGRIKLDNHHTAIYERRLRAEAEHDACIMRAAKTFQAGGLVYVTRGVTMNDMILYDVRAVGIAREIPAVELLSTDADTHQLAVSWVMLSMAEYGPSGAQLLPEKRVRELGLISDPNRWVEVGNYLRDQFGVIKISNQGNQNGTYTKAGQDLQGLRLALSLISIPPALRREPGGSNVLGQTNATNAAKVG